MIVNTAAYCITFCKEFSRINLPALRCQHSCLDGVAPTSHLPQRETSSAGVAPAVTLRDSGGRWRSIKHGGGWTANQFSPNTSQFLVPRRTSCSIRSTLSLYASCTWLERCHPFLAIPTLLPKLLLSLIPYHHCNKKIICTIRLQVPHPHTNYPDSGPLHLSHAVGGN